MEFYKLLDNICSDNDCYLEYVDSKAIHEYIGWENSRLIFSHDAKMEEVDIVIIRDYTNPRDFIHEFSLESNLSTSHKKILKELLTLEPFIY